MKDFLKVILLFCVILSVIPITDKLAVRYSSPYPRYYDPDVNPKDYSEKMGIDILRSNEEIVIVDSRSGHVIFELSKNKVVDDIGYSYMSDILLESSGGEGKGRPSASYWRKDR